VVLPLNPSARATVPLHSGRAPPEWFFGTIDQVRHSKGDVPISRAFDTQFAFPPNARRPVSIS
jgi:hypothetical protein